MKLNRRLSLELRGDVRNRGDKTEPKFKARRPEMVTKGEGQLWTPVTIEYERHW